MLQLKNLLSIIDKGKNINDISEAEYLELQKGLRDLDSEEWKYKFLKKQKKRVTIID